MSRSDWIKSAAFVALLLVILGIGALYGKSKWEQYAADRYAATAEYEEDVKARVSICREPDGFISFLSCAYEASNPNQGDYTSQKDLRAQQDMSIWALGMFVASVATLFVTAFGVFFVWLTLKKADETNQAAVSAANAATDANQIMRNEQRPWLDFEILEFKIRHAYTENGGVMPYIIPKVQITNHGKSPAFKTVFAARMLVSDTFESTSIDQFAKDTAERSVILAEHSVFPGTPKIIEPTTITFEATVMHISGSDLTAKTAYIMALVEYVWDDRRAFAARLYTCKAMDLLPRPTTDAFKPVVLNGFEKRN